MKHATWAVGVLFAGALSLNTGCIIIAGSWDQHTIWTPETTERIQFDASGLKQIDVQSHNGAISFVPEASDAYVVVKKKAGGCCTDDAEDALGALDVYVQRTGNDTCRMGYKWDGLKHSSWRAAVAFEIHGPADVSLTGQTHNGSVTVDGLQGSLNVETHNGSVRAATTGKDMSVLTHNGRIDATFGGRTVDLVTYNGSVTANLTDCGPVDGRIATHNGSVELLVGPSTDMDLDCHTDNGTIRCSAPIRAVDATRRSLRGRIGDGSGGSLAVETHNGSVHVTDKAG